MQKVGDLLKTNEEMEKLIDDCFPVHEINKAMKEAYYKGIEVGRKL